MCKDKKAQEKKTERIQLRATKKEFDVLAQNAERAGMSLSSFLIYCGLNETGCDLHFKRELARYCCELYELKKILTAEQWEELEQRSGILWQLLK